MTAATLVLNASEDVFAIADAAIESGAFGVPDVRAHMLPVRQARTSRSALYVLPGDIALWRCERCGDTMVLTHLFGGETIERSLVAWRDDLAFGRVRQVG